MQRLLIVCCALSLLYFCQTSQAGDKNKTEFGHKRAYEGMLIEPTLPVATDVPDRILLSWKQNPANSFSVTWRSKAGADAVAEIAPAEAGPQFVMKARLVRGKTSKLKTNLGTVHMHAATFTDLEPGTLYAYRVGSRRTVPLSEEEQKGVEPATADYAWSEWLQYRTAQESEGDVVAPVSFVYVGDAQNDVKSHWSRLIRESFRDAPRMTFMLHAGDLVNRGNNDQEWGEWFYSGDWIFSTVPQLAVPGNHEYDRDRIAAGPGVDDDEIPKTLSRRWAQRFEFPENGPKGSTENIFYVDVQGVRIIGLDSNRDPETQKEWLEKVLQNNPNRWTILTHHHPIYSSSVRRDNPELRKIWQRLYEKYNVDLVLQGHDHSYGRTGPISLQLSRKLETEENVATGLRVADQSGGPVYVVSVSGPKMYELKQYPAEAIQTDPFRRRAQGKQLYQVITVEQDRLVYQAKTVTGKLYDQFTINKDKEGKNIFEDQAPPLED
ncbi:purple acid phosphatase family protein [Gimesia chilikensis]|uniref:purple acid phosphatase family protein n=1 Tax=Gimesia chilikensis TaxID=2605989 RepID=UPI001188C115|nr:metallophosphoesterase family protein [Gimesia chilikensis]QDT83094.1 cyclic 3',5'-adenosine monophosphate phosphodiesterase [Gimesia chilikensis]